MKTSSWLALAFWATMGVGMLIDANPAPDGNELPAILVGIVSVLFMFGWYIADSNENNIERNIWLNICVVAVGFAALPYYRFRYFGARRGAVFIGWVIAALVGTAIVATMISLLVYGFPDS